MINLMRLILLTIATTISFLQAATVNGTVSDSSSATSLAGVRVQLRNGNVTVATDTTDNTGAFVFQSVDTGTYSIRASLSGYTTKSMNAVVATDPLTVVIPLVKIITTTLSGKVTDSTSGEALAGAVVRLGTGFGGSLRFDTTGADGLYSFDNVATGTQTLQITSTGYTGKSVDATLSSADPVTANILLVKVFYTTISGKVTDSTSGEALAGVIVRLSSGLGGVNKYDTTGADGTYSFDSVSSGNQTFRVSFEGYTTKTAAAAVSSTAPVTCDILLSKTVYSTISGKVTDSTSGEALTGAVVRLGGGAAGAARYDTTGADGLYSFDKVATGNQNFQISATGYTSKNATTSVIGADPVTLNIAMVKVIVTTVSGKISDSTSAEALSGVIVRLGSGFGGSYRYDTTAADGLYSFDNVATGNQTIQASLTGYTPKNATAAVSSADPVTCNISLVKMIVTTISGIVSDSASGAALGGVIVRLGSGTGGTNRYDTTGADGLYSFDNVATGNQSLRASLTGYTTKPATVSVTGATPVTLNILLTKAILTTVTGKVTDTLSGAALAGAIVRIGTGMSLLYDTTDADGMYSISNVNNGAQSITITLKGYATKVIASTITGTDPVTVNVQLKASVSVLTEISKNSIPAFSISKGILKLQNMSGPGVFKLYNLNGKLICKLPFTRSTETLHLPQSVYSPSAAVIANVITDGKTFTQKLNFLK